MESWDDENFEPLPAASVPVIVNKWEGEDEDDDVKESWEDEDEEKKEEAKGEVEIKKAKKKSLAERVAEKERLKREEMERKLREEAEEEVSPEERLRLQKESDLQLALATTFDSNKSNKDSAVLNDLSLPNTKEEFETFTEDLSKKLVVLSKSIEYPNFVESLSRNLCATMSSLDIKKVKNSLDNLFLEKQKIEKGDKSKKNKGKGKARLHIEGDNQLSQLSAYTNDFDEFDDFM